MKFALRTIGRAFAIIGIAFAPALVQADEIDDVLDDLIDSHGTVQAVAQQPDARASLSPEIAIFSPVSNFQLDTPIRTEDSAAVEYRATYVSLTGGASFEVQLISPSTKGTIVAHGKLKDAVGAYQQSMRAQPVTIKGAKGGYIETKDSRAAGTALALANGSYLLVRASRALEKKELVNFVESLGIIGSEFANAA